VGFVHLAASVFVHFTFLLGLHAPYGARSSSSSKASLLI
jgi:hypothetical protein